MKKLSTILGALAATLALNVTMATAHSASMLDRIKDSGVLRVGVKADYKPFGFMDTNGKIIGFEPDLAADMAEKLGVKVELVPVQTANRIEFLQQNRIDLMIATMSDSEQRRKVVGIIEPYYYSGGTGLLMRKDANVKEWEDLKGKPICGTQGASYNRGLARNYGAQIIAFPGIVEAQSALLTGSCIGLVQDSTFVASIMASGEPQWNDFESPLPVVELLPWSVAVPLPERNGAFGKFVSDAVADWHKTGLLLKLEEKWNLPASDFLKEKHEEAKGK